jgi:isopenicillin-N N-acyltransferase like protein
MTKDGGSFPLIDLSGSFGEIGRQYGRAASAETACALEEALRGLRAASGKEFSDVLPLLDTCRADYQRYAPHLLDEVSGIAEGAGLSFEEALFMRTRWDVGSALRSAEGCTSFVANGTTTASGKRMGGQNKDVDPGQKDHICILRHSPTDKPARLCYAYYGMCDGPGFNSEGLMRFDNSLYVDGHTRAIPVMLMKRLFMECSLITEAIEWLNRFKADGVLGLAGSFTLSDRTGRLVTLEVVPGDFRIVESHSGVLGHANTILHLGLVHLDRSDVSDDWNDSSARSKRINGLLQEHKGSLTLSDAQGLLSDHEGHPGSICRHRDHAATVGSVIAIPEEGVLYAAKGNPCEGTFAEYHLKPREA